MSILSFDDCSYLGVPFKGVPLDLYKWGQVRIHVPYALEDFERNYHDSPNSSPLQGIKAQLLQSLFVGKVTKDNYQLCGQTLISLQICHEVL